MDIKPEDVIEGRSWKYMRVLTGLSFLHHVSRPVFGGKAPDKKEVKVNTDYVWKSLL